METSKAYDRRVREGFFEKYCNGTGLDIGGATDTLVAPNATVRIFDKQHGDATFLEGVANESFDFVYSSHCLEHLPHPDIAIKNWYRVLKQGGYLIVSVPHRDLYEKQTGLPSRWNHEHSSYWLPYKTENEFTFGMQDFITEHLGMPLMSITVQQEGFHSLHPREHSTGEYSIECIIKKL